MTSVRPFGGGGRCAAMVLNGSAAATAASNSDRRKDVWSKEQPYSEEIFDRALFR